MTPGRTWEVPRGLKLVTIADNDPRGELNIQLGIPRQLQMPSFLTYQPVEYFGNWQHYTGSAGDGHVGGGSFHLTYSRNATACVAFESQFVYMA